MSVLGEAGGFEVEVTRHGNVELFRKPGWPQGDAKIMPPPQARALAALLVTAADEAERGKPTPFFGWPRIGQALLPDGDWKISDQVSVHGINGLEIPPGMPVHTVVCIDGKARALDADGKILASNVQGDPGVEKGGE